MFKSIFSKILKMFAFVGTHPNYFVPRGKNPFENAWGLKKFGDSRGTKMKRSKM